MLPLLIPILGLAIQHAPALIGLLAGEKAGDVATSIVSTVKEVVGTSDPAQAQAKLAADPALADQLTARLNAQVDAYKAELEDTANARAQTIALVQAESRIAWAPVILTTVIFAIVAGVIAAVAGHYLPDNSLVVGWALAAGTTAYSYWLGSSSGSRRNGDVLRAVAQNASLPPAR